MSKVLVFNGNSFNIKKNNNVPGVLDPVPVDDVINREAISPAIIKYYCVDQHEHERIQQARRHQHDHEVTDPSKYEPAVKNGTTMQQLKNKRMAQNVPQPTFWGHLHKPTLESYLAPCHDKIPRSSRRRKD